MYRSLGVVAMVLGPIGAWASEPDCHADLTCARSALSVVIPPKAQGPDLSAWRLAALDAPAGAPAQVPPPPNRLTDPTLGIESVLIPGACYRVPGNQGPATDDPALICLAPYYLGVHEISFAAYDRFASETQRDLPSDEHWGRGNRPAINVNLYDAQGFAKWLSRRSGAHYRLPTETEWEHAARAGSVTAFPWGETVGSGLANCAGCGSPWDGKRSAPVGSFPPNPWGLHDMIGNVGEWTCSMRDPDAASSYTQCDGIYATRRRIYRNGGWSDRPERLVSSFRDWNAAFRRTDDVGFRLVRECPECIAPSPADSALVTENPTTRSPVTGAAR